MPLLTSNAIFQMLNMSDQSATLQELPLNVPILSLSDRLARISALLETALDCKEQKVHSYGTRLRPLTTLDLTFLSGKMLRASSSNDIAEIFGLSSRPLPTLGFIRSNGQLLNTSWVLPQNRERIYLVGRLAEKCRDKVFPVCESVFSSEKKAEDGPEDKDCCGTLVKSYGQSSNWITYVLQLQRGEQFNGTLEAIHEGRLRLLTETECERLQGFPDGFTRYGVYDGEVRAISRTQRYSLLGNAVSPPIVEKVAARIRQTTNLDNH